MALKRKNTSTTTEQVKKAIKVNPYENPENVLDLMANICSAKPTADTDVYWGIVNDSYNKEINGKSLSDYLYDNRRNLLNADFDYDLKSCCRNIAWSLSTRENTRHTQIVVAGGFSSGKSSFLNRITKCTDLLPTGTDPVSVVKTYLYCSQNAKQVSVKGVNQKNVLVSLNTGVLQAIQHADKSKVHLASVLDKLFVEIPSKELDGLVFIDTPGYNNSDRANQSNGKTDKETALEALGEGNVLFWLVGIDRPTLTTADWDIIKTFEGRKVFIFNKTDKIYNENNKNASLKEIKRIIDEAATSIYKHSEADEVIDLIAFSALDNRVYYSKNNKTLNDIIAEAKEEGDGNSEIEYYKAKVEELFDNEIEASQNAIIDVEKQYAEKIDYKEKSQKYYLDAKEYKDSIIDELQTVLVDSYNNVMGAADKIAEVSSNTIDVFYDFIKSMYKWDADDHSCLFDNTLTPKIDYYANRYGQCVDKYNEAIKYTYYKDEYRKDLVDRVNREEEFVVNRLKDWYDQACEDCDNSLQRKQSEETIIRDMQAYKRNFLAAVDMGIRMYQDRIKATKIHNEDNSVPNVFECIKNDNYKMFLHSFENEVDLSICNADGYNPMTLAVLMGNNTMVQFMLDHGADPNIKDGRGYNAFHVAVENQYRDICKILLDNDPDLINTQTKSGESVEELANKQTFTKWIQEEIDNAL